MFRSTASTTRSPSGFRASDHLQDGMNVVGIAATLFGGIWLLTAMHAPASAQEADQIDRIAIPYTQADLLDPARTQHLLARINAAALAVCGEVDGMALPTQETVARSDCHSASFARAIAGLKDPALTELAHRFDPWTGTIQPAR